MVLGLFVVGVLVTAAGFVTIGFGVPINAFSLGNTLIVAGTIALVGGLVLIALAVVVRQLQRITAALSAPLRTLHPAETAEPSMVPPTARLTPSAARAPMPPQAAQPPAPRAPEASMPRPPEPRAMFEPRFPATAQNETAGPLEWLRKGKGGNGEAPVVEVLDEAPLQPPTSPRPASPLANMAEPIFEPKAWSPSRGAPGEARQASRAEHVARTNPAAERPKDNGTFDVVWPNARPERPTNGQAEHRHAAPEMQRAHQHEAQPAAEPRGEAPPAPVGELSPVAILKSGVIDGMAYTLYADGSIEAELPQGTVRFASIDELRAHLEKHS
jgi:hypothetical protein